MDDVIADFYKAAWCSVDLKIKEERMWNPSFFLNLQPIPGAKYSLRELEYRGYDVWILTQPLAGHPECYHDKALWIQQHFPQLYNKLILTQDKGMLLGEYLIDDNLGKWKEKFEKNGGTFIHFRYGGYNRPDMMNPECQWKDILYLLK